MPIVHRWPTVLPISYGKSLGDLPFDKEGKASVPGIFAFRNPEVVPKVGTSTYSVFFTADDVDHYDSIAGDIDITVKKATPMVNSWPVNLQIVLGKKLSDVTLAGSASTPGKFTFSRPGLRPKKTGSQKVIFKPDDSINYNQVTGKVTVKVNIIPH